MLSFLRSLHTSALSNREIKRGKNKKIRNRAFVPMLQVLDSRDLLSVTPVSIAADGISMGNGNSGYSTRTISADGVNEVFASGATNLVSVNVSGFVSHVYLRNLSSGITTLVDINKSGDGSSNGAGAGSPSISGDGRYITFISNAQNLTDNDAAVEKAEVYVRDMKLGQTFLVSLNQAGTNGGNGDASTPIVTVGNGHLILAYAATANDLTPGNNSTKQQIYTTSFQLDPTSGAVQYNTLQTRLISSDSAGNGGNNDSGSPLLSDDGATLAFSSRAGNLNIPGGYNVNTPVINFYVYTFSNNTLRAISVEPTTSTNATSNQAALLTQAPLSGQAHFQSTSANGRYAVFASASDNLVPGNVTYDMTNVYRRDLVNGTTELVSVDLTNTTGVSSGFFAREAVISADGRYVAFSSNSGNLTNNTLFGGIFVRDMVQGQTYYVSLGLNGTSAGGSNPSIGKTASGQLVIAYSSGATNLTPNNTNTVNPQVYVTTFQLDVGGNIQYETRVTTLVSADSTGNGANGDSSPPVVSADGSTLAFTTRAQNLPGETSDNADGFPHIQLFTYKVATGTLVQVSNPAPANGFADSTNLSTISDNGRYLTYDYITVTSNSHVEQVMGWDGVTGLNTVIYSSVNAAFGALGQAVISADGSTIAFAAANALSYSANFVASDWQSSGNPMQIAVSPAGVPDSLGPPVISGDGKVIAYTYEPDAQTPFQLYIYSNGSSKAAGPVTDGNANTPAISADGSKVIFSSTASNQMAGILNFNLGQSNLYTYDVSSATIGLLSAKAPGLFTTDQDILFTNLSADGRYVAFGTVANDLFDRSVFEANLVVALDLQQGTPVAVVGTPTHLTAVALSGDGSTVVFVDDAQLGPIPTLGTQVYSSSWLAASPDITLISVNAQGTGGANDAIFNPTVSTDGQVIAFSSNATNLVAGNLGTGGFYQIYVRNGSTNTTSLVSLNSAGTAGGNDNSQTPQVSDDGAVVTFVSFATNLMTGISSTTGLSQVYSNLITASPSKLVASSGGAQTATVEVAFAAPLVVTLTDQFGKPISGVNVSFAGPANGAGVTFPAGTTVLTNAQGQASITLAANGTAGSYNVTASVVGLGSIATFGLTNAPLANATISGIVFQDYNLDGQQTGAEPGIANQVVYLDSNNNSVLDANEPTILTSASGSYSFSGLAAGTYTVRQVLLGGVLLVKPASGSYAVTVSDNSNMSSQNFANVLTSIAAPLTIPPETPFPDQGNANANYVQALFRSLLLRNADQSGLSFWTGQLNGGIPRARVVEGIRKSVERFTQAVDDFYETLLGRNADSQGQTFWVGQLESGVREEQIAINFLNSQEYLGKGDKFFVDSMYQSLLGRTFDTAGEQFWLSQLAENGQGPQQTHAQVVNNFLFSRESLERLVEGYYEVYLRRHADTDGMNGWVAQLQQGLPFVAIGEQFLASDEFFDNAVAQG